MPKKPITVTAALPYANGPLHIGHIAGAYLPADIFVRYQRLKKENVLFICGSDEHGAAITIRAKKEGITPQEIIDKYHELNKNTFQQFGIDFDIYHRTSLPIHHKTSQEFFTRLYEKGEFIEEESEQYYDEEYNQFLADRYITGTCPICQYPHAYGDQCENCGSSLSPNELINPVSTLSGKSPVLRKTKHWYLPLNKYQQWLEEWILVGKKETWKPNVYGQCSSWLTTGLQPRAMTRDLDWGVDVPLPNTEGKKLYVWLDAPIGYISATKDWAEEHGRNWEDYWKVQDDPANNARLFHFIGKDNIVFHCLIFPSILHAHGDYILPENVPANEFLNLEGDKLSTSRNWAVWLHEYLQDFPGKQDVLRYALCATLPETRDSEFTWKDFQARNNNELVAILGNFVNRALVLTKKYFNSQVPEAGERKAIDQDLLDALNTYPEKIGEKIEQFRFREAQALMMEVARLGNRYLAETEPWHLIKTDEKRVKTILNTALQLSAGLSVLMQPFLPHSAKVLKDMLNIEGEINWDLIQEKALLDEGHQLNKPALLFEKLDDTIIDKQLQKLEEAAREKAAADQPIAKAKAEITFDDFTKMDIRVGTILTAEKVKKSKKLLKLTVDTGIDQRTVMSGIGQYYQAEDIIGQQVSILVNLAPRKIMGVESQGMILMAEDQDGTLHFIMPDGKTGNGSTIN
jgi:methionyl-tRNA synthetase